MSDRISDEIYDDLLYNTSALVYDKIVEHIDTEGVNVVKHQDAMQALHNNRNIIIESTNIPKGLTTELLLQNTIMSIALRILNLLMQANCMEHIQIIDKIFNMKQSNLAEELKAGLFNLFEKASAEKVTQTNENVVETEPTTFKIDETLANPNDDMNDSNASILIITFLLVMVSLLYLYTSKPKSNKIAMTIR